MIRRKCTEYKWGNKIKDSAHGDVQRAETAVSLPSSLTFCRKFLEFVVFLKQILLRFRRGSRLCCRGGGGHVVNADVRGLQIASTYGCEARVERGSGPSRVEYN